MSGRGGWSLQEVGLHPRRHQTFGRNLGGSTSATTSCRMAVGGVELELLVVYIYIYICPYSLLKKMLRSSFANIYQPRGMVKSQWPGEPVNHSDVNSPFFVGEE